MFYGKQNVSRIGRELEMKRVDTMIIEKVLQNSLFGTNPKLAKEYGTTKVTLSQLGITNGKEIVDFMSYDTNKDTFRCYEIKVTKEDLVNSSHGHNFYGNYNFYVIPIGLYSKIKDFVPKYVGVIGFDIEGHAKYIKEAKFMTIRNLSSIKLYLIRSLYREFQKTMNNKLQYRFYAVET